MVTQAHERAFEGRWAPMLATALMLGLAAVIPPSAVAAQGSNPPIVQVICQVNGGVASTVRVTYPAAAVRNIHGFLPIGGGATVVFNPPATANQVYTFAVPAGRYKMRYTRFGAGQPVFFYNPVIVIPPFKVVGQICERSQAVGTPST
jgi:hypothetical protein